VRRYNSYTYVARGKTSRGRRIVATVLLLTALVFVGGAISWILSMLVFTKRDPRVAGLTGRIRLLGIGHSFLVNKYYLDHFYEKVVVRSVAYPISRAAYWFNQNILDGVLHGAARVTTKLSD
ncbi:MAG: hypothetical protein ACKO97_05190, partial [Actinomycetota bacterium]